MNSRLCSSLEPLEARIAPAGIVTVTSSGGSVKIVGDGLDNDISISFGTGSLINIIGNNGTTISGPGGSSAFLTKDLTIALGDGRDTVSLAAGNYAGNVTLDGGAGDNTFSLTGATFIPGTLKVLAGAGTDTLGDTSAGADLRIGRDLVIKLGDGGVISTLTAARLLVGGKLSLTGGSGIEDFSWNVTDLIVGSDVSVATGKGLDRIGFDASGDVNIGGKLGVKGGDSAPPLMTAIVSASFNLTAGDEMSVRGPVTANTVAGTAVINLGGTNMTNFGGLSIKTGKGDNTVTLNGATQNYLGKVSVTAGGPTDFTMQATTFFIGGDLTFKGSAATDGFDLEGAGTITGKASVDLGAGAGQSLIFKGTGATKYSIAIGGGLALKQGAKTGNSTTTASGIINFKKFSIATGGADDAVTLDSLSIIGSTGIALGAGADTFALETQHVFGAALFSGAFKLSLGDGADTSTMGASTADDKVVLDLDDVLAADGTLDAGKGTDTVSSFSGLGNTGTLVVLNVP
ncbi:MAG: hypothetical protein WCF18_24990 [Chthoniobacteraceae bacterium]